MVVVALVEAGRGREGILYFLLTLIRVSVSKKKKKNLDLNKHPTKKRARE
jgi:hypothetical protein